MEAAPVMLDALDRARESLQRSLDGLSDEELLREPHPPIGWLAWRMARILDSNMSALGGRPQLWIDGGWHARFGMAPEPRDFGPGVSHTREQVSAFRAPSAQMLLDYFGAAFDRAKAYLDQMSPEELDRELDEPRYQPLPTVAVRLVSVAVSTVQSAGMIGYVRGLIRLGGWFPAEERRG